MIICGIYKITSPNSRIYIGSSKNILSRKRCYKTLSCQEQPRLYNSLKKYGWEKHKFEILEECELKDLFPLERAWGLFYNSTGKNGLNCQLPRCNEEKPVYSEDSRKRRGDSQRGRKHSEESKFKMSESAKNMSIETKEKISKALKGRIFSKEHLEKIRLANIGKKRSEEVRKQIIINLTNRKLSKEQIKTIKEHNYKQVIDTITGVIYISLMDASEKIGIKYSYLCKMVKGKVKNKTNLIYYHAR